MEEFDQNKQKTIQNILDHKKRVKELQEFLKTQNKEYSELQQRKEEEEIKRQRAKGNKNKFSSFANAINRPPFFSATHVKEIFVGEGFINNEVPVLTAKQQDQLIEPSRNVNPEYYTYKIDHPLSKLESEFPILHPHQMSEKEVKRLMKWQQIVDERTQIDLQEKYKQSVGSAKKQEMDKMEHLVFKVANASLRMLDPKPSLISENPITPRRLNKLITLPRLYEKKVWVPNDNYY